jgi:hypothetical protein
MELRERVARKIAQAFTDCDPDMVVYPEWPPMMRVKGAFVSPQGPSAPLFEFFLHAADEAIEAAEQEFEALGRCWSRHDDE